MTDESMTSYTLRHLRPNSFYKIEIRAKNDLGVSEASQLVIKTSDSGLSDSQEPPLPETSTASPSLALVSGLILLAIVVLLLATDAFFFIRFKVGIFYFLTQNAFKSRDIPQRQ